MNLFWQNKAPYIHKVNPHKVNPKPRRYVHGFKYFLVRKKIAIENYLAMDEIWKKEKE